MYNALCNYAWGEIDILLYCLKSSVTKCAWLMVHLSAVIEPEGCCCSESLTLEHVFKTFIQQQWNPLPEITYAYLCTLLILLLVFVSSIIETCLIVFYLLVTSKVMLVWGTNFRQWFDWLIDGLFTPCQQHRPYSQRELFGFYSSFAFTKNVKAHNQFVSVDTYKFKKLTDYIISVSSLVAKGNKISDWAKSY